MSSILPNEPLPSQSRLLNENLIASCNRDIASYRWHSRMNWWGHYFFGVLAIVAAGVAAFPGTALQNGFNAWAAAAAVLGAINSFIGCQSLASANMLAYKRLQLGVDHYSSGFINEKSLAELQGECLNSHLRNSNGAAPGSSAAAATSTAV